MGAKWFIYLSIGVWFLGFNLEKGYAEFWDRPDYFEYKEVYDEVSNIIDVFYHPGLTSSEKDLLLRFRDPKLLQVLKALKTANETKLIEHLKKGEGISDETIELLMDERPVIDALKITLENDFIVATDRYYTHGTKIELSFNNKKFEEFFKKLGYKHTDLFFLCKQTIYNQSDRNKEGQIENEPGMHGIAYCGFASNSYKVDEKKGRIKSMDRVEIAFGALGESAFAEQVQNGFHRLIGDKEVNWDYQLSDKFYFHIDFNKYVKVKEGDTNGDSRPDYNIIVSAGGHAGTISNYLNAGVILNYRLIGSLIDMYTGKGTTPSEIERLAMLTPEQRIKEIVCKSDWNINMFVAGNAKYVINNKTIDGTGFEVSSKAFVYDLRGGLLINYKDVSVEFALVHKSNDWRTGGKNGGAHNYGIMAVSIPFRNFSDLGAGIVAPLQWITDPDYRKAQKEKRRIKRMLQQEGLTIIVDKNDESKNIKISCD